MSNLSDTVLKDKRDAERMFCACVMVQHEMVRHDCGWLSPDLFSDDRYKKFWSNVIDGVDSSTAAMDAGVFTELIGAQMEIVSSMAYPAFARSISEGAYMVDISERLPRIAALIGRRDKEKLYHEIESLTTIKLTSGIVIENAIEIAMKFAELVGKDDVTIKTGIGSYDKNIGGYARKTLNIIAARPSMGKTALAWQIVRNFVAGGKRVIFFSLEMPSTTLWARAVCGALRINLQDFFSNRIGETQKTLIINKSADLMNLYGNMLMIDDSSGIDSPHIWQGIAEYRPDAIVVDHSSLVCDKNNDEILRLGEITRSGKDMAREFDIPVIYLQQLSRATENYTRKDKRPTMSDLRGSGKIEENADTVTFIYRNDYYEMNDNPDEWSETELIVAKNRDGKRNTASKVHYNLIDQWFYGKEEKDSIISERRKP
jgi:replicative DNA helicase